MGNFLSGVIVGICALWVIQYILARVYLHMTNRQIDELEKAIAEQKKNQQVTARVEKIGDDFYIYNIKNGEFIAQGRTLDEINSVIRQRWPDRMVLVTEGVGDAAKELKATV